MALLLAPAFRERSSLRSPRHAANPAAADLSLAFSNWDETRLVTRIWIAFCFPAPLKNGTQLLFNGLCAGHRFSPPKRFLFQNTISKKGYNCPYTFSLSESKLRFLKASFPRLTGRWRYNVYCFMHDGSHKERNEGYTLESSASLIARARKNHWSMGIIAALTSDSHRKVRDDVKKLRQP